jgi:hypothetical protein
MRFSIYTRGGLLRSSKEAGVMPVERRGRVADVGSEPTGNRRNSNSQWKAAIDPATISRDHPLEGKPCEGYPAFQTSRWPVWLQKTDKFVALKTEVLDAAVTEPYESTEYQGMVDLHWSAATLPDAKRLAEALTGAARTRNLFCYTS